MSGKKLAQSTAGTPSNNCVTSHANQAKESPVTLRNLTREKNTLTKSDLDEHASQSNSSGGKTRYPVGSDEGEDTSGQTGSQSSGGGPGQVEQESGEQESGSRSDPSSSEHGSAANGKEDLQAERSSSGQKPRYPCLAVDGAMESVGSINHPSGCKPCAFYCYSPQNGCRNGLDCVFCHLDHMSRLKKKKEEWKRNQREKRHKGRVVSGNGQDESLRPDELGEEEDEEDEETVDDPATTLPQGDASGKTSGSVQTTNQASCRPPAKIGQDSQMAGRSGALNAPVAGTAGVHGGKSPSAPQLVPFSYTPPWAVLGIQESLWLCPPVDMIENGMVWAISPELPRGLRLDPGSGLISGAAKEPTQGARNYFVTACKPAKTVDVVSAAIVTLNVIDAEPLAGLGSFGAVQVIPKVGEEEDLLDILSVEGAPLGFAGVGGAAFGPGLAGPVDAMWPMHPEALHANDLIAFAGLLNGSGDFSW
mmetsp:Transcript_25694/g.59903  ORF Transcript_25694/g.59903 Transcript_25694/m.59903 type:complete len:477 (+) Transcript_25694:262-1692(+)|eukprot:CAMPEP_0178389042 /NCGR_PEP_ID=MMETSP0689_2-20121128/9905_1 /TAXON_ID=160604 /ORGANISM="Amphidinium massartii, Strain CS-259" /LENGTH=476 /DNA_ID=CAMNT_0020009465 /DNA_START=188 /DNA_END=1618 /DNA_ORIENTATION=+